MVFLVDSADHTTGKTGLTLTITVSKDGGAFGPISPSVTERGTGWYNLALTSSETDTLGDLAMHITAAGADPLDLVDQVVPARVKINAAMLKNTSQLLQFQMTDSSSHQPVTGLVDGDFTKKIVGIDGASGSSLSGTITEVDSTNLPGFYKVTLTTGETNGDSLAFHFFATDTDHLQFTVGTNT
jgi:hypothetical protein